MLELAPDNIFIALRGLIRIFRLIVAISDHAIKQQIGEVFGLIGSGKITLLNIGLREIDMRDNPLHGYTDHSSLSRGDRCALFRNAEIRLRLSYFGKDGSNQYRAQSRAGSTLRGK